jgi:ankyrin repeat domain-containing protein 49
LFVIDNPAVRTLWAAETGNIDILNEMLQTDPNLVNAVDNDGYTPLHRAAYEGHVAAAEV